MFTGYGVPGFSTFILVSMIYCRLLLVSKLFKQLYPTKVNEFIMLVENWCKFCQTDIILNVYLHMK